MSISDTVLHRKWCRGRNADAFTELVRRHSAMVFSACMRVLGNESAAEELTQDCFVALMNKSTPIAPSIAGWLHTVATRRAIDRLRTDTRRNAREDSYAAQATQISEPNWDDVSAQIDQAISELAEDLRLPVVLRFLDGRSHKEIAKELGISLSTVKRRLNKGIASISKRIGGKGIVVSAAVLVVMLDTAPAFALRKAIVAEMGKQTLARSWAVKAGASGATALKNAGAIGGIIVMKKLAVIAVVVVLVGLVLVQRNLPADKAVVEVAREEITAPVDARAVVPTVEPDLYAAAEDVTEAIVAEDTGPSITGLVLDPEDRAVEGATVTIRRIAEMSVEIDGANGDVVQLDISL